MKAVDLWLFIRLFFPACSLSCSHIEVVGDEVSLITDHFEPTFVCYFWSDV